MNFARRDCVMEKTSEVQKRSHEKTLITELILKICNEKDVQESLCIRQIYLK